MHGFLVMCLVIISLSINLRYALLASSYLNTTIYFNLEDFPANNREIAMNKELNKVNVWLKLNKFREM